MKKMVWSIIGFIVLSVQVLMGDVVAQVLPSFGELLTTTYQNNAIQYFKDGNGGSSDTPSYYQPVFSGDINEMIRTVNGGPTGFTYWKGEFSPTGNFSGEYGGMLYFSARIIGSDGDKVSLNNVSYDLTSSAYLTAQTGDYSSLNYSNTRRGVNYNSSSDPADWTFVTSGANTTECDEIWLLVNKSFVFDVVNSGTKEEMVEDVIDTKTAFSVVGNYYYNSTLVGTETVNVIPEPAIMGMIVIGGVLIWVKRRFYART